MPGADLVDLAASVADGDGVDWDAVVQRVASDADRVLVGRLRVVQQIARLHSTPRPAREIGPAAPRPDNQVWGPFVELTPIGSGTSGDVYRARDPRLDRHIALKLLRNGPSDAAVIEEARLMARVRHPNVVTIHGAERIDGRVGLWMEFVDGRTLEDELREKGPCSPAAVRQFGRDLCGALGAVHAAGLLHRDVKAQNVIRDREGHVRLADFGTGIAIRPHANSAPPSQLAGTPLYLAPEILAGNPATTRSDIYSLGVLLFHLLTGTFPVSGGSLDALRAQHAEGVYVAVGTLRRDVPRSLASAIERACNPDPAQRFASAAQFAFALETPSRIALRRLAMGATAAGLAIALVWTATHRRGAADAPSHAAMTRGPVPILVAQFENESGEALPLSLEPAVARVLTDYGAGTIVPRDHADRVLRLMRRPPGSTLDEATALDVARRDGTIGVVLAGAVERAGGTLRLTLRPLAPGGRAAGPILTASVDPTKPQAPVSMARADVREVFTSVQDFWNRSVPTKLQPVTTASFRAFELYNQAYERGLAGAWPAAEAAARLAVAEDPACASCLVWLAWAGQRADAPTTPSMPPVRSDPETLRHEIDPLLNRALVLARDVSDEERYWIEGSVRFLRGDFEQALRPFEALLALKPGHDFAAVNLGAAYLALGREDDYLRVRRVLADARPDWTDAAFTYASHVVALRADVTTAARYFQGVVATTGNTVVRRLAQEYLDWMPVYAAWSKGDVKTTLALTMAAVERARKASGDGEAGISQAAGFFNLALGRLSAAREVFNREPAAMRDLNLLAVADLQDDTVTFQRLVSAIVGPEGRGAAWTTRYTLVMRAGLVDKARDLLARPLRVAPGDEGGCRLVPCEEGLFELGTGELLLREGHADRAVPHLERGLVVMQGSVYREYYQECEALAAAYRQLGQADRELQTLESCAAERPRFHGAPFATPSWWMKLRLTLADAYRARGREVDSQREEQSVRLLLVYADADHPLRRR